MRSRDWLAGDLGVLLICILLLIYGCKQIADARLRKKKKEEKGKVEVKTLKCKESNSERKHHASGERHPQL